MLNDYKDIINMQKKYPGLTKEMRDMYEKINMDSINFYPVEDNAKSNKTSKQEQCKLQTYYDKFLDLISYKKTCYLKNEIAGFT